MKKHKIPFIQLEEEVLNQLKSLGYRESTLTVYRRFFNRIYRFLVANGGSFYSPEIGENFLSSVRVQASTKSMYACAVRRLDDYINDRPYRCHHGGEFLQVPRNYAEILEEYLSNCRNGGNRPATLKAKEKTVSRFLLFVWGNNCHELHFLDARLIARTLLIFDNKDHYPRIREFLRLLADRGITTRDFSGMIPKHRRKNVLPSVYSVEELRKAEQTIDISTQSGRRNLAMVLLATRMGLRAGDIAKLRLDELDFSTGYLHIIQEKTLIPLTLKMPDEVKDVIEKHLSDQSLSANDGYVFHSLTAPYERVTPSIIRHVVNKCFTDAKIDISERKHGPHALRSSLASSMVNDGASYETVRRILGHTDPDIIKHYARSDIANLRFCAIEPPTPSGRFEEYLSGKREVFCHV